MITQSISAASVNCIALIKADLYRFIKWEYSSQYKSLSQHKSSRLLVLRVCQRLHSVKLLLWFNLPSHELGPLNSCLWDYSNLTIIWQHLWNWKQVRKVFDAKMRLSCTQSDRACSHQTCAQRFDEVSGGAADVSSAGSAIVVLVEMADSAFRWPPSGAMHCYLY